MYKNNKKKKKKKKSRSKNTDVRRNVLNFSHIYYSRYGSGLDRIRNYQEPSDPPALGWARSNQGGFLQTFR